MPPSSTFPALADVVREKVKKCCAIITWDKISVVTGWMLPVMSRHLAGTEKEG